MILLDTLQTATGATMLVRDARDRFEGFAHDSRAVLPGDCFVAVRGMHGDGHAFLRDALERGAACLLVERDRLEQAEAAGAGVVERARRAGAAVLAVANSRAALRDYAAAVLEQWRPVVVAVTGSTGKTTTKEAIAEVLATQAPTFRSWRNYNDLLGLPLALGRLEPAQRYAVLELGADHPGEIAQLCALLKPTIGVVTNVSAAHLHYFGTVEALAEELAQLPAALPAAGFAVLNGADATTRAMAERTRAQPVFFATEQYAVAPPGTREALALMPPRPAAEADGDESETLVFAHLHGDHWADTIRAALAVGTALGVGEADVLAALRDLTPLPGRMRLLVGEGGMTLLDDSHNATPASVAAGLAALEAIGRADGIGPVIAVQMREDERLRLVAV
ncbi:MAG: Mur ligase family protein, partial [Ktedonobacterales bacterium]